VSGDAPGRFVIRPDPRRHRRHALNAAPLVTVAIAAVTVRLAGEMGWLAGPTMATLVGPLGLICWAYVRRHRRTVSLALTDGEPDDDGQPRELALTDWRGRVHTLRKPSTVLYCTIYSGGGRMEHVVVAGPLTETPLLLRTRQWRPDDLAELWRRLGLEPAADDLTSVPGVRSRFPGVPLPYATRYPLTIGLVSILIAFGYLALIVSFFRDLA
jgi:hypothetical protein